MMHAEGSASAGMPIQSNPAAFSPEDPPTFDLLPPISTQASQYNVPKIRLRAESAPNFRPVSSYNKVLTSPTTSTTGSNAAGGGAKLDAGHRFMSAGVQCPHYRDAYSCPSSPAQRPTTSPEDLPISCPVSPLLSPIAGSKGPINLNFTESQPFELPPSTAKEWQRRNRFDQEDNVVLEGVTPYEGSGNIEQHLHDITSKVETCKSQGPGPDSEKSNVVPEEDPETGDVTAAHLDSRSLHMNGVLESDDGPEPSRIGLVKRSMQAVKSALRKIVSQSTLIISKCKPLRLPVPVSIKDKAARARRTRPFADSRHQKELRRCRILNECETQPLLIPSVIRQGPDGGVYRREDRRYCPRQ